MSADTDGREPSEAADDAPLANPIWRALTGPQADVGERHGRAARYPTDIAPFAGLDDARDPAAWADLARLLGPAGVAVLAAPVSTMPAGWALLRRFELVQMVDDAVRRAGPSDDGILALGATDRPEMQDLVRRTEPGPFAERTDTLGGYVGVRVDGRLAAMGGRRMHPPGWVEVSAVCTDPAYRGRGLARRVLDAVIGGIHAEGERSFLHVLGTNLGAIRLYEAYGFVVSRRSDGLVVQPPA